MNQYDVRHSFCSLTHHMHLSFFIHSETHVKDSLPSAFCAFSAEARDLCPQPFLLSVSKCYKNICFHFLLSCETSIPA